MKFIKKLGIKTKLFIVASTFLALCIFVLAFGLSQKIRTGFISQQAQFIKLNPDLPWYPVTKEKIMAYGITAEAFDQFMNNESLMEIGLISETPLQSYLLYIQKDGDQLKSKITLTGVMGWWKENAKSVTIYSLIATLIASGLFVIFIKITMKPVEELRRTTENILAGRFEVKNQYTATDDLGRTYQALRRLCVELEEKNKALEKVSDMAFKDGMTGLSNFRAFKEKVMELLLVSKRHGRSMAVALIDVDHFKKFNDTYGHQQGDEVLRKVGETLMATARRTDFVARYGGEEFVILMPETEFNGSSVAAEKVRQAISETKVPYLEKPGETLSVTISVGVVAMAGASIPDSPDYKTYIEVCDKNLYQAKKNGRNCVVSIDLAQATPESGKAA